MMGRHRAWLPKDAFTGPATIAPLAEALASWSAEWLAQGRATLPYAWVPQERAFPFQHPPHGEDGSGSSFTLTAASQGEHALIAALFGQAGGRAPLRNAADSALLRHVAEAARADLTRLIGERFAPAATTPSELADGPFWCLPITLDDETEIFTLIAAEALLIAVARQQASNGFKRQSLAPRQEALHDQPIAIAPIIGLNRVALADLEKLGAGDVIPLDTPIGAALDLSIGARARAGGAATIALTDQQFEIRIERPISEW